MIDTKKIIVIDDFYEDPYKIREIALKENYPDPYEDYTYPGKNSEGTYYNKEIHEKMESALGQRLIEKEHITGRFRLSLENDSFKQDIHIDYGVDWGCVLFLSDPKDCIPEGGTSFWRHKTLEIEMCPRTIEGARYYGYSDPEELRQTMVYNDGLDRSKWDRYLLVEMKFNRLVIFKPNLWHSHNFNFGNSLENGRLVQLFFYNNSYGYLT